MSGKTYDLRERLEITLQVEEFISTATVKSARLARYLAGTCLGKGFKDILFIMFKNHTI